MNANLNDSGNKKNINEYTNTFVEIIRIKYLFELSWDKNIHLHIQSKQNILSTDVFILNLS